MNNTDENLKQTKSPETVVTELKQEFCKKLDALSYGSSHYEVFRDWAEIGAIAMHQLHYHSGWIPKDSTFEAMELQYLKLAEKHKKETLSEFAMLLGIVGASLGFLSSDFLGTIYIEMEMGGGKNQRAKGELFTPYHLSKLIAEITLQGCEEEIKRKGYFTISDPACGSGGTLIAASEVIAEKEYQPRHVVGFEAVDVNPLCCHMAYIQLACLDLTGTVCHGNTITQEIWKRWDTPSLQFRRSLWESPAQANS